MAKQTYADNIANEPGRFAPLGLTMVMGNEVPMVLDTQTGQSFLWNVAENKWRKVTKQIPTRFGAVEPLP